MSHSSGDQLRVKVGEKELDILSESLANGECRTDEVVALKSVVDSKKYVLNIIIKVSKKKLHPDR